jgi:hypothetical protein
VRLLAGFLVTLALVELVGVTIVDRNSRSGQIAQYAAMQRTDVRIFESIGRRSLTTDVALRKIAAVLKVLGQRPGPLEAQVQIDRAIVAASATEPAASAVLLAMAMFANRTGAVVIAEGIEDLETLEYLRNLDRSDVTHAAMIQAGQATGSGGRHRSCRPAGLRTSPARRSRAAPPEPAGMLARLWTARPFGESDL